MIRYPTLSEILSLYDEVIRVSGGAYGLRDLGSLESALHQPRATFGGVDLYPTIASKAATLGYSLIMNHTFVDGNKRIGLVGVEFFLELNGFFLDVDENDTVDTILTVAKGEMDRDSFCSWIESKMKPIPAK
jgi:death-on-curing protein